LPKKGSKTRRDLHDLCAFLQKTSACLPAACVAPHATIYAAPIYSAKTMQILRMAQKRLYWGNQAFLWTD
jgi:hypothetical protein